MCCTPRLIFDGIEGVGSRFHILRSRTRFRPYRGRQVLFLCFMLPDTFWAAPRARGPFFMFYASRFVFNGTESVRSCFYVCLSRTRFGWNRGCRVQFSCFALIISFWAVPRATSLVFILCAPGLIIDGTEDVGSRFHVLRSRTRFEWFRGRLV
jgi:hypothetical protein